MYICIYIYIWMYIYIHIYIYIFIYIYIYMRPVGKILCVNLLWSPFMCEDMWPLCGHLCRRGVTLWMPCCSAPDITKSRQNKTITCWQPQIATRTRYFTRKITYSNRKFDIIERNKWLISYPFKICFFIYKIINIIC